METDYRDRFSDKYKIGEGGEHKVYVTEDGEHVIKIPNLDRERDGKKRPDELLRYLASPERRQHLEASYRECENLFRQRLIPTSFINHVHPETGQPSYVIVQPNMQKLGLVEWNSLSPAAQNAILNDPEKRGEVLDFVWTIKKYFYHFKVPFDFHAGNIAYRENSSETLTSGHLFYFTEVGFPLAIREVFEGNTNLPYFNNKLKAEFAQQIIDRYINGGNGIIGLRTVDERLKVTDTERAELNKKHFNDESFDYDAFLDQMESEYKGYAEKYLALANKAENPEEPAPQTRSKGFKYRLTQLIHWRKR